MIARLPVLAAALVVAGGLSGCSDDGGAASDSDRAATAGRTLCRSAAVVEASLSSTRRELSRGNVGAEVAQAYADALARFTAPASDPDVPVELAGPAVAVVAALDEARALVTRGAGPGVETALLSSAAVAGARAADALATACAEAYPDEVLEAPAVTE